MENLLSQRPKNLIVIASGGLILLVAIPYLLLFNGSIPDNRAIQDIISKDIKSAESALFEKITDYKKRAAFIFNKYRGRELLHSQLEQKEALIFTRDGTIFDYYGEIYYFKFKSISTGDWIFLEKKKTLYFMQKMAEDIFYTRYFCHMGDNFILDRLKYDMASKDINFFKDGKGNFKNSFYYDEASHMFSYFYLLKECNNRLGIYLKFSKKDIEDHFKKKKELLLFGIIFAILLMGVGYFYKKIKILSRLLWIGMLLEVLILVSRLGERTLYLVIGGPVTFYSIYQVLVVLIIIVSLFYWFRKRIKLKLTGLLLFNLMLIAALKVSNVIIRSVNFLYTEPSVNYFILILVIFILHLLPFFFIRNVTFKKSTGFIAGFFLFQVAVSLPGHYVFGIDAVNTILMTTAAFMILFIEPRKKGIPEDGSIGFGRRPFLFNVMLLFLMSVSIFYIVERHVDGEKKEFIAHNLRDIFLNQNNYAKFIAREIVYQLNLESKRFYELFEDDASSRLRTLWQKTLAYRENIASGIFVLSPSGEIMSQHSYLMPYLDVKTRNIFPFWAIEDTSAELFGKTVSLAVASMNVVSNGKHHGRIIVQVLNSPELILRHQDKVNIFTIDNKIKGTELSYIKLNEGNQIVENPSNINLQNVSGLLESNEKWINFRFIDQVFKGYIFKHDRNTIIIFFPEGSLFKQLSEIVIIFIFLLLLYFLFYFKYLGDLDWKSVYYSFSIRVFSFLILISLVTAVIFSLFSLDFNSKSSIRQSRQMIYESGRTAQNIGYNQLTEDEEFTPDHLLLISRILNTDVSVYENGVLLDTSNYKKIINNRIPDYLHSNILELLNRKNQKFVLLDDDNSFHLYFKIYDYILDVNFSYSGQRGPTEGSYYTDFIITLFFILTVVGFSSAFLFRNKITAPIHDLNQGMAEVEKGNLNRLKKVPSEIELKNLYTGFNSMIKGIREQKKNISEISRMKTIIKLGRRVAHEVKNPLTPIKLSAEQILMAIRDKNPNFEEIIKQSVDYIIDEANHLKKVSYGFLDLSKLDELSPQEFDLAVVTRDEVFKYSQIYSHIAFHLDENAEEVPEEKTPWQVKLDKFKLKQVFKNLINNSIEAIGEKDGEVQINLKRHGDGVRIEVADNGSGMDEDALGMIYNVDYSTKKIGTGLGLFIVKRIIELHKGQIRVESEKNKGTRVLIDLPVRIK